MRTPVSLRMTAGAVALAAALVSIAYGTALAADEWHITMNGQWQGLFRAGGTPEAQASAGAERILCHSVMYELQAPQSPARNLLTGAMRPSPVVVTRPWGPVSPQTLAAAENKELLTEVVIERWGRAPGGPQSLVPTYRIRLQNARIVKLRWYTESGTTPAGGAALEEISLSFQRMTLRALPAGPETTVTWGPSVD